MMSLIFALAEFSLDHVSHLMNDEGKKRESKEQRQRELNK